MDHQSYTLHRIRSKALIEFLNFTLPPIHSESNFMLILQYVEQDDTPENGVRAQQSPAIGKASYLREGLDDNKREPKSILHRGR